MDSTLDIRKFEKDVESIYEAVIVTAKRARQIHKKTNDELKRQLGEIENDEEYEEDSHFREAIAKKFDSQPKPSMAAIAEFLDDKITRTK